MPPTGDPSAHPPVGPGPALADVLPSVARSLGREITLTLGWGTVARVDLVPASCADPDCDADHGYEGTVTGDDIALRISAAADGEDALAQALTFARDLSAAIGQA